jgi:FixJ family two-component response regulator
MKAGAVDFLSKPINQHELLNAVESAKTLDGTHRDVEAQRTVVLRRMAKLTAREKEVLDYVVKGWLNKQIGAALGVHEKTIKVHRGRMLQKLGVRSIPDLVRMTALVSQGNGGQGAHQTRTAPRRDRLAAIFLFPHGDS